MANADACWRISYWLRRQRIPAIGVVAGSVLSVESTTLARTENPAAECARMDPAPVRFGGGEAALDGWRRSRGDASDCRDGRCGVLDGAGGSPSPPLCAVL